MEARELSRWVFIRMEMSPWKVAARYSPQKSVIVRFRGEGEGELESLVEDLVELLLDAMRGLIEESWGGEFLLLLFWLPLAHKGIA